MTDGSSTGGRRRAVRTAARRRRAQRCWPSTRRASAASKRSLVEGPSKKDPAVLAGRTRQNKLVHFTPPKPMRPGTYVNVLVVDATTTSLLGEFIEILAVPTHRTRIAVSAG